MKKYFIRSIAAFPVIMVGLSFILSLVASFTYWYFIIFAIGNLIGFLILLDAYEKEIVPTINEISDILCGNE